MTMRCNLVGSVIGQLTVADTFRSGRWVCQCSCGELTSKTSGYLNACLKRGINASCGCARSKNARKQGIAKRTHGLSGTKLHVVWKQMKARCSNPKDALYCGRGITVCDEWSDDFCAFHTWAMKNGYAEGMSIERRDNDKGYEPGNCTFIPLAQQALNSRRNRIVTHDGRSQPVSAWARETGINYRTLMQRLNSGWPPGRALVL
jgi:hypothetical protein